MERYKQLIADLTLQETFYFNRYFLHMLSTVVPVAEWDRCLNMTNDSLAEQRKEDAAKEADDDMGPQIVEINLETEA